MAHDDTPLDFATAVGRALSDDERASQVGLAGRQVGVDRFDHRQYGPLLLSFLVSSAPDMSPCPGAKKVTNAGGQAPVIPCAIGHAAGSVAVAPGWKRP